MTKIYLILSTFFHREETPLMTKSMRRTKDMEKAMRYKKVSPAFCFLKTLHIISSFTCLHHFSRKDKNYSRATLFANEIRRAKWIVHWKQMILIISCFRGNICCLGGGGGGGGWGLYLDMFEGTGTCHYLGVPFF